MSFFLLMVHTTLKMALKKYDTSLKKLLKI